MPPICYSDHESYLTRQKFPTSNSLPFWLTERSRSPAKMGNIRGDLALQENGTSWPTRRNGASSRWGRPVSHCLRVGLPFWLTAGGRRGPTPRIFHHGKDCNRQVLLNRAGHAFFCWWEPHDGYGFHVPSRNELPSRVKIS